MDPPVTINPLVPNNSFNNNFGNSQTYRAAHTTLWNSNNHPFQPKQAPIFIEKTIANQTVSTINQKSRLIGDWVIQHTNISIRLHLPDCFFSAEIYEDSKLHKGTIQAGRIKCGIEGNIPHPVFYHCIEKLSRERKDLAKNIAVLINPGNNEGVTIFEVTGLAYTWVINGKANLDQLIECSGLPAQKIYKQAIGNFQQALKSQKHEGGDTQEIESIILSLQNKKFLNRVNIEAASCLHPERERTLFNDIISSTNPVDLKSKRIVEILSIYCKETSKPHQYYLAAWISREKKEFVSSVNHFLSLAFSNRNPNPAPCLKNIQLLIDKIEKSKPDQEKTVFLDILESLDRPKLIEQRNQTGSNGLETIILQKDAVRMAFEKRLEELSLLSDKKNILNCFICFNLDERDISRWLEFTLTPDMEKFGIKVIACFRQFGPGKGIIDFEKKIIDTDLAVIVCTPEMKKKCVERSDDPTGVSQEVKFAKKRKGEKRHKTFLVYLEGNQRNALPDVFFEDELHVSFHFKINKINGVYNYYQNCFELFGEMLGIPREDSRNIKRKFINDAHKILKGNINILDLEQWREINCSKNNT